MTLIAKTFSEHVSDESEEAMGKTCLSVLGCYYAAEPIMLHNMILILNILSF